MGIILSGLVMSSNICPIAYVLDLRGNMGPIEPVLVHSGYVGPTTSILVMIGDMSPATWWLPQPAHAQLNMRLPLTWCQVWDFSFVNMAWRAITPGPGLMIAINDKVKSSGMEVAGR